MNSRIFASRRILKLRAIIHMKELNIHALQAKSFT